MSLKIKDIPDKERPRERLLKYGKENSSLIELLAILLKTGSRGENAKELAVKILELYPKPEDLKNLNKESLKQIKGIGPTKIATLLAAIDLCKRVFLVKDSLKEVLNNPKKIYDTNRYLFDNKKQEYFYCLYLDSKKRLIERKLLFMGTLNQSLVHPREIFKEAYLHSASSVVCMHNHPSGDVTPSEEDIILTKTLMDIGRLQQMPIIDHIIFGDDSYYSFYENSRKCAK